MLLVKRPDRKMILDVIGRLKDGSLSRSEVVTWHQAVVNQFGRDLMLSVADGYWYFRSLIFLGVPFFGEGHKTLFLRDSDLEEYVMDIRRVPATEVYKGICRQRTHQLDTRAIFWPLTTFHYNQEIRLNDLVLKAVRGTFEERGDMVEHSHLKFRGVTYLLVRQFDESANRAMILGTDRDCIHLKDFMEILKLQVW
ncbi:MAG: hypothetical protein ACJ0Q6_08800 [Candidatus Azotimanducaceae bacterium]|uniref:Uncharacterized protein n=1 Tax=OM182 bacterium TaxID=2510334 RepID=A0A520RXU7_9GAMM|nr:hypothetical protein [Gammaproteobacteria bacterium]OUV67881.1 MAG: hypothetical protein CBC93_03950 [Gammaproteobacteria bacterium TMED133]RZO75004.1 MAG: hypothetical protein EVA68_08010 [OM182 bacterium]